MIYNSIINEVKKNIHIEVTILEDLDLTNKYKKNSIEYNQLKETIINAKSSISTPEPKRNTLKEIAPRKIEGDNLNVLYFTNGSTWIPYRLWSKSGYDISIGQKSYSVLPGNGQQLAKFISDNVNKSQSCPILSDDLVFQGLFINDTKKETIEVPLFLVNTACIDKSQPMFKFSYYDWLTIEELKQLKS